MNSLTQWQPTAQISWVKRKHYDVSKQEEVENKILCQMWMEFIATGRGPQLTGNGRWQEIPTIEEPKQSEAADDAPIQLLLDL